MKHDQLVVRPGRRIKLTDYDPGFTGKYNDRVQAADKLSKDVERLARLQSVLYANGSHALLVILQAMDAAGKDGVIAHVMKGANPQGTQVYSFKAPSTGELDHDYLWRCFKALPERGHIGIFNRSYYEEVLVVRVHPELLENERIPSRSRKKNIWRRRFDEINNFERYLVHNGIHVLKFFLNVSREEQKRRFLARIETPEKNWKFSTNDVKERACWDDYMAAYQDAFRHTSTEWAPWYIIPADNKWFTRIAVADVIVTKLKSLRLRFPVTKNEHRADLLKAKEMLESEA
jgi:PPK2 family polyphosphate:nucleotide phosphotransferase